MSSLVDIHMHTNFSDGALTPEQLIHFAKSQGVGVMCINDHDTVKGVMNMLNLTYDGITVLCGIEITTCWKNNNNKGVFEYNKREFP